MKYNDLICAQFSFPLISENFLSIGLLYDMTGTYSLAFFFSGGTAALAICVMFQVPIFKAMQGNLDRMPSILNKGKKEGTEKLMDTKPSFSSKTDSGISLQGNSTPPSNGQSNEYLHIAIVNPEKSTKEPQKLRAVWREDMNVLIVPEKDFHECRKRALDEKLQCSTAVFPLITDFAELEEVMKKETDI